MDFGPCGDWPVLWPGTCIVSGHSPVVTGEAVTAATQILWARSGRQFGLCTTTLRPCRSSCYDPGTWPPGWVEWPGAYGAGAALVGGAWFNLACGSCPGLCSCSALSEVLLPGVVHDVVTVRLDGSPMASGAYRVDDNRRLVRVDGGVWPWCNDLTKADTQAGTWSVTARYGQDPPVLAQMAVGELACELLRWFDGEDCRLPRNLTSLVRQGVTIELPDPNDEHAGELVGLYLSDLFINTVNPHRLPARSRAYSVDRPRARRAGT